MHLCDAFSLLFANAGCLATAHALSVVKDTTGSFASGFLGISALCIAGAMLSIALARVRLRALVALNPKEVQFT